MHTLIFQEADLISLLLISSDGNVLDRLLWLHENTLDSSMELVHTVATMYYECML